MIDRTEIIRIAGELGLQPQIVEKDYVLGWVLAGIARDEELLRAWLFKGGTCLKKCFFETYRFSEDLDFTVTEPAQLDRAFLLAKFNALAAWLYDATGIELPADQLRFDVYDLKTGGRAGEGRIAYRGPIAPRGGSLPRIKLDLTADERVVLPSVVRPVAHPYTDMPEDGITARCYAFEELFGEKVRALAQRARPRDLLDLLKAHYPRGAIPVRDLQLGEDQAAANLRYLEEHGLCESGVVTLLSVNRRSQQPASIFLRTTAGYRRSLASSQSSFMRIP